LVNDKKAVWGWAMYDWANSAYVTTVMAGFFPVFFTEYWSYGADVTVSTAQLGFGNSVASLIVALVAPVLGAVADKGSAKKKFMLIFAYLGVLMSVGLFMVQKGQWALAIFVYAMGIIGFSGANIFYDSLLPSVADEDRIDYVSSLGFSMGYLGGGLLFLINVLMTLWPQRFGLPDAAAAVRVSFLTVAVWWGAFTLFAIAWIKEAKTASSSTVKESAFKAGFRQLFGTFKKLRHMRVVLLFLAAYWFYIDGVDTIIRMAVKYGLSLGFESSDLIVALLIVQFVGFPAALVYGKLGQIWGVRKMIYTGIAIYMAVTVYGTMMTQKYEFYILAIVIGLAQGGIQALSRSYYSRLIPKDKAAEFYGFYNMLGKFAAIIGPALMAIVGLIASRMLMPDSPTAQELVEIGRTASRWSIASILILFIVGAGLFHFVDEEKGREQAKYLSED
jgi:UMF1 family MFS transporter